MLKQRERDLARDRARWNPADMMRPDPSWIPSNVIILRMVIIPFVSCFNQQDFWGRGVSLSWVRRNGRIKKRNRTLTKEIKSVTHQGLSFMVEMT